jgi:hypothetical protein
MGGPSGHAGAKMMQDGLPVSTTSPVGVGLLHKKLGLFHIPSRRPDLPRAKA